MRAAAFDDFAGDYDADFTHSPVGNALRAIVAGRFEKAFKGAQRVLDLGSGSGEDASRLGDAGVSIPGIDASSTIVRATQENASCTGRAVRVEFRYQPSSLENRRVLANFADHYVVEATRLPVVAGADVRDAKGSA